MAVVKKEIAKKEVEAKEPEVIEGDVILKGEPEGVSIPGVGNLRFVESK